VIPALREKLPTGHLYSRFLEELRAAGFSGDITVSDADRTVLATDNSVYQVPPQAIIFPRAAVDVVLTMQLAAEPRFHAIVLTPRGGGTGTNGQSLTHGVMMDLSRHMNRILEINVAERWARVEAGVCCVPWARPPSWHRTHPMARHCTCMVF